MKEPKTILITGASSGLGKSLALAYAAYGKKLFLIGRDGARLAATSEECRHLGADVRNVTIDVTDAEKMRDWIISADTECGGIDLVIANAGISGGTGGQGVNSGESESQVRKIFETNIDGTINTLEPIIPLMKKRRNGQIAIISSLASFRGLPSAPAYSASKAAVRFYGEALRGELREHGIGVSVICPGYIKTPMTDVNKFPMPLIMEAEDAADLIRNRLEKNPPRIAFPFPLYFVIWLAGLLSPKLTDPIFERLPRKD